jgi:hypothetical protein
MDVTKAGEGLQNLGLHMVLSPFEQGGIFVVAHPLRNKGCQFLRLYTTDRPLYVSNDKQGLLRPLYTCITTPPPIIL